MSNQDNFDNVRKANFKIDMLKRAEEEMYYDNIYSNNPGHFNTESMNDTTNEAMGYHKTTEPFDHCKYLDNLVIDEHTRKNHNEWVDEVSPWAGTASVVGLGEFNAGDYLNFQGLRRPRGVQQIDPWQITEVDENQLMDNKPFTL